MRELVVTHDSTATPENVWSVLTDLDNAASTISAIEKVERLDDGGGFSLFRSDGRAIKKARRLRLVVRHCPWSMLGVAVAPDLPIQRTRRHVRSCAVFSDRRR